MNHKYKILNRIFGVIVICLTSLTNTYAQPKAIGAVFSFTGFSLVYEHNLKDRGSFIDLRLKGETSELFLNRKGYPGLSASFTWNIYLKEWTGKEGNKIRLYTGPGAIIGYGPDYKENNGLFFGMKGIFGCECLFPRNITLSATVSPVIGSHIINYGSHITMKYYKNGIYYCLVPQIGIKYRF